jgi:hypothetical protein
LIVSLLLLLVCCLQLLHLLLLVRKDLEPGLCICWQGILT